MVVGGAWRIRSSKSSLATCEFGACLGYKSLSQKAEKRGGGGGWGGRVGGWEEEERRKEEEGEEESTNKLLLLSVSFNRAGVQGDSLPCI